MTSSPHSANNGSLHVLILVDLSCRPIDQNYSESLSEDGWVIESDVYKNLESLGHKPRIFGIYDDIAPLLKEIRENKTDVVFNLCESFKKKRSFEPNLAAFLELLNISYTGASPEALSLCKDKSLTKKILNFHKIKTPDFLTSARTRPLRTIKNITYPVIIKPLGLEASEGISLLSLVEDEKAALERIEFLHQKFQCDVIVEEFIIGREIYVSVMGNERLTVFPPRELSFGEIESAEKQIATFHAKWDDDYRKKWGIHTTQIKNIETTSMLRMEDTSKQIYRLLKLNGYARIDFRLKDNGDFYFIEANPNPNIGKEEDFAKSAEAAGLNYKELLRKILNLGLS